MSAELDTLRSASRRLARRFAVLVIAPAAIMAGLVIGLVVVTQHHAMAQQLVGAEHVDSPRDAPLGTYIAIVRHGSTVTSDNAPDGFPDTEAINDVSAHGGTILENRDFAGEAFTVRTDADSGQVVQVAVSRREDQAELRRVVLAVGVAGIPTVAGAVLLGWWMSVRAMRPLADALALQRRFVADAGHELRTPLTLLSTRAQMLRVDVGAEAPGKDEVAAELDEIVADANALTEILEDLLIAADPRRDAERTDLDLAEVAGEAAGLLRAEAASRGLGIAVESASPVIVSGVRAALFRVVVALLSNAVDHARGHVSVGVRAQAGWAVLEVADDGPGFPPGIATQAFERFASTRTSEASAGGRQHYGLGLALVSEVAHRHGGNVEILQQHGQGAMVRVHLPLQHDS